MTVIGLVRHGVTDWNMEGRMQGRNDIPLNDEGRRQAELLGKRLAEEEWDLIYSSDMIRARETADIIAARMGKHVEDYHPKLAERSFGTLEGTTEADRIAQWGEGWRDVNHGGEPKEDVVKRALAFMEELHQKHTGKRILLVSHGAVIGSLMETMFPEFGFIGLRNTCVNVLQRTDRGWDCLLYNCIKHLEDGLEA